MTPLSCVVAGPMHGGGLPLILAAVASTVVVAAVSWRVVETPFLRMKERFSHPPEPAPAPVRPQPADAGALALEAARIR
jgi:peptidoglycan/LPS O-acetylase OafA/YrhL